MELVKVSTHTKGKNSQPFDYMAVGEIKVIETTDRETKEVTKTPTLVSDGLFKDTDEIVNHFYSLFADKTPEEQAQAFRDAIAREANRESRRQASPSTEYEKVDELTPIVEVLVSGGYLELDKVGPWRRLVTQSSTSFELPRVDVAKKTKEYRAAVAGGASF